MWKVLELTAFWRYIKARLKLNDFAIRLTKSTLNQNNRSRRIIQTNFSSKKLCMLFTFPFLRYCLTDLKL